MLLHLAHVPSVRAEPATPHSASYVDAVKQAVDAHNIGDFEQARRFFARAHALEPSARTWHGLGTCAFELGSYAQSVFELRHALEDTRMPLSEPLRADAEHRLREASARVEATARPAAPRSTPESTTARTVESASSAGGGPLVDPQPEPHKHDEAWRSALLLSTALTGASSIVVGGALGLRSMRLGRERDAHCPDGLCQTETDYTEGHAAAKRAMRKGDLSTVFWSVGLVSLTSAAIVWWTAPRRAPSRRSVELTVGARSLRIEATW